MFPMLSYVRNQWRITFVYVCLSDCRELSVAAVVCGSASRTGIRIARSLVHVVTAVELNWYSAFICTYKKFAMIKY